MTDPKISFATTANPDVVSDLTLSVLRGLLAKADCASCIVTSTARTPAEQARAMYRNIVNLGVTSQLALYGPAGDEVIATYVKCRKAQASPVATIAAMTATIKAVGPGKVSHHCGDPSQINVVDIAPSSIADPVAFAAALEDARDRGVISQFFSPGDHDPAFHIEVKQPPAQP